MEKSLDVSLLESLPRVLRSRVLFRLHRPPLVEIEATDLAGVVGWMVLVSWCATMVGEW